MKSLCCGTTSSGTPLIRKLLQLLIKVGCFTGCAFQSSKIVQSYFDHGSSVVTSDVARQGIVFPSVTVCVDAWTNKTRLCELKGKCTRSSMRVVVAGFVQTFDLELRNKTAFEPHELFSCKMRSKAGCNDFDCSRMMKMTLFRRPLQKCYTLDLSQPAEKNEQALLCKEQWNWELRLESKLNASNSLIFMRTDLFPLIVKAPSTAPFATLTPIAAQTGRDITVTMKQSCVQECQMKVEMTVCGCITSTHEFADFANLPVCVDFAKGTNDLDEVMSIFCGLCAGFEYCRDVVYRTREYRNCLNICGPPCEEITYDVRLSSDTEYISGSPEDKIRFAVTLKFASDSMDLMEHHPMMSKQKKTKKALEISWAAAPALRDSRRDSSKYRTSSWKTWGGREGYSRVPDRMCTLSAGQRSRQGPVARRQLYCCCCCCCCCSVAVHRFAQVIEVLAYLGGTVGTWLGCNLLSLLSDFGNWLLASIDRLTRCTLGRTRRGGAAVRRQHAAATVAAAATAVARLRSTAATAR
ncbi:uncharacterized protein LOC125941829 [Dermacentor silvarum]|uniref:uncharacterized protein LOC125941829 n=1 Tax=Dermacentor silvarum TaxID=543639 RepID=UPI002100F772|nr:uncharacterized protein LOC125941829 [Dermacentor silvarum]